MHSCRGHVDLCTALLEASKLGTMTDTDMKNKGSKGENRQTGSERVIIFHAISLFRFSYLLELEELLLDLEPLCRRLVGLAPDELEHLVAAAADGPLGGLHHVGGRGHGDDRVGDVGPVCRVDTSPPPGPRHCTALSTDTQWALARWARSDPGSRGSLRLSLCSVGDQ